MHLSIGKIVMGQKITIGIGGKRYELNADSVEKEEIYRQEAASVNKMLADYTDKFPGKELSELLAFVALNESIGRISMLKRLDAISKEVETLERQTDTYLEDIDNQPPAITR